MCPNTGPSLGTSWAPPRRVFLPRPRVDCPVNVDSVRPAAWSPGVPVPARTFPRGAPGGRTGGPPTAPSRGVPFAPAEGPSAELRPPGVRGAHGPRPGGSAPSPRGAWTLAGPRAESAVRCGHRRRLVTFPAGRWVCPSSPRPPRTRRSSGAPSPQGRPQPRAPAGFPGGGKSRRSFPGPGGHFSRSWGFLLWGEGGWSSGRGARTRGSP